MTNMRKIAVVWAYIVLALIASSAWVILDKRFSLNTDILALLPAEKRDPVLDQAFNHVVDSAQQRMVVLIGAKDWDHAVKASDAYNAVIRRHTDLLQPTSDLSEQAQKDWLSTFQQSRLHLLTAEQRTLLETAPASQWKDIGLSGLYNAFSGPKTGTWQDDPFNLFGGWIQERAQETPVRPREGKLFVAYEGHTYVMSLLTLQIPAFSMQAQDKVMPILAEAEAAAHTAVPDADILSTGMVLHASAASAQASKEMSTIGIGSVLGILLFIWLSFRSIKPVFLLVLSITIGCLGALTLTWLMFGQVHLLTLVFGASLIGIAQDYGIYFLCARLTADNTVSSPQLLQRLIPSLSLMLGAAIIGYMGLILTPFTGLQQMAVFSSLGLIFAWLTVVCWFPVLVKAGDFTATRMADRYSNSLQHWPTVRGVTGIVCVCIAVGALAILGAAKMTTSDDIRALQKSPQHLIDAQIKLGKILDIPAPVQFYLVRGATQESVLQREEQLKQALQPLIDKQVISGYQAVSNWVPSQAMQIGNHTLITTKLLTETGPLTAIATAIDETPAWASQVRTHLLASSTMLMPDAFIASPAGLAWRHLWLGKIGQEYASIVTVRGLNSYANLPVLAQVPEHNKTLEGVQWVDKVADISGILQQYRQHMSWVVLGAYLAIFALLFVRYRAACWRIVAPPAIASIITLSVFSLLGIPLQLFHVLACMLILGLGVDYGIFLHERRTKEERFTWLAIGLSAISALLAFGLLALSNTPPLHAFGLTMLSGMTLVWLIAPCFRQR